MNNLALAVSLDITQYLCEPDSDIAHRYIKRNIFNRYPALIIDEIIMRTEIDTHRKVIMYIEVFVEPKHLLTAKIKYGGDLVEQISQTIKTSLYYLSYSVYIQMFDGGYY